MAICSQQAITNSNFPKERIKSVNKKNMPSIDQILELLRTRRSTRVFKNHPVEKEEMDRIINAARFAPSTNNIQSTKFIVVQNKDVLKEISALTAQYLTKTVRFFRNPILNNLYRIISQKKTVSLINRIPEYEAVIKKYHKGEDIITHNAPALLFFHSQKNIGFSDVNASLAIQNAMLATHGLGLGSFYAGYVVAATKQQNDIPRLLRINLDHEIHGCIAIGYPKLKYEQWIERKTPNINWKQNKTE
jgi:nitroreductase